MDYDNGDDDNNSIADGFENSADNEDDGTDSESYSDGV